MNLVNALFTNVGKTSSVKPFWIESYPLGTIAKPIFGIKQIPLSLMAKNL
jgi:hypothetical protein